MPTTQQESMSTGGSENPQITPQIKLGVLKDTVIVSLLKSPDLNVKLNLLSQFITTVNDESEIENDIPQVRLKKIKRSTSKYTGVKIEEIELSQFLPSESRPELHECWAWDMIMHYAVVRYFELWKKGRISDVYRGVAGKTKNIESSISGMIGGVLFNKQHAVTKDSNGRFYPIDFAAIYPNVPRLNQDGIDISCNLARSMKS